MSLFKLLVLAEELDQKALPGGWMEIQMGKRLAVS